MRERSFQTPDYDSPQRTDRARTTRRLTRVTAALVLSMTVAGCAGPGVLSELPDPVFASPRQAPPARVIPQPAPRPAPPAPQPRRPAEGTVVVDAGHGGKDPGAAGVGPYPEKVVNLAVSMRLVGLLRGRGFEVITTRNDDRFISLDGRAGLADRSRADLFVSIHADSASRTGASGATIYISRNASTQSRRAADRIVDALKNAGINCRGVKGAGFRVLVGHSRPAVLVECGFLTNPAEARLLATPAYQARLAEAIAEGITRSLGG